MCVCIISFRQVFALVLNDLLTTDSEHWIQTSKSIVQFSSVTQLCPTLCDPMKCSSPGLPVHQQLLEFTQTHIHWVGDAIQPSHPLSSPSSLAFNLLWTVIGPRQGHQLVKLLWSGFQFLFIPLMGALSGKKEEIFLHERTRKGKFTVIGKFMTYDQKWIIQI